MRALQKLVRNGNSTAVSIPRPILVASGLLPGQAVIVEMFPDKSLHVRLPTAGDFGPVGTPRIVYDEPAEVKP